MDLTNELIRREPVFQHPEFGRTLEDFEKLLDRSFYQINYDGLRQNREQVIKYVTAMYADPSYCGIYSWPDNSWEIREFEWHTIAQNRYLVTYILDTEERTTRQTSIWKAIGYDWTIMFHQSTVLARV